MVGTTVEKVDLLFWIILGFSLVLLTAITITMIYFVVKYRRSKNPQAEDIRGNIVGPGLPDPVPITGAFGSFTFTHGPDAEVDGGFGADLVDISDLL